MSIRADLYYFKKSKKSIAKDMLLFLVSVVNLYCALGSRRYVTNFFRDLISGERYSPKQITDNFCYLRRRGLVKVEKRNNQIYISLTQKGKDAAGKLQIDYLEIKKSKKWDKKWRIVIFDIPQSKRIYREALRGKLKQLGFYRLQQSIWIHPFDCRAEIEILKDFFGFTDDEIRYITAVDIGNNKMVRDIFGV
ncbi:MAG: CRISPR-associated endonuclease Cas2 [Parcubacteria group bacterium]|nr:CRISPR-associated endonuclease Cas2 [Parcubacteria group bacterium]